MNSNSSLTDTHLVYGERLPFDLLEILTIFENELVRGQEHIELEILQRPELKLSNNLAGPCRPHIADDIQIRAPDAELHLPRGDGGEWNDNKEGTVLPLSVKKVGQKSNGLNGFTKSHLIVNGKRSCMRTSSARMPFSPLDQR